MAPFLPPPCPGSGATSMRSVTRCKMALRHSSGCASQLSLGPSPLHDCLELLYFSAHRTHALELVLLLIDLRAQLPIPLPREATYTRRWIECRFLQDHLVVLKLGIPCVKGVSFGPTEPVLCQQRLDTSHVVPGYND